MFKQLIVIIVLLWQWHTVCPFDITVDTIIADEPVYPKYPKKYHKTPHKTAYVEPRNDDNYADYVDVKFDDVEHDKHVEYVEHEAYPHPDPGVYPHRDQYHNTINKDINIFLAGIRRVKPKKPNSKLAKKPIYRSAITIIANSAQKEIAERGHPKKRKPKKMSKKRMPKAYMPLPVPQAISHILGKEHMPYGQVPDLRHSYNY